MKKIFNLYNNSVRLEFDDYRHLYTVDERIVYGVTSVVGIIAKDWLAQWAVNQTIEFYKDHIQVGGILDEVEIEQLHHLAKYAHRKKGDDAKLIGTLTHSWIESFINAGINKFKLPKLPTNANLRQSVSAFLSWVKEHSVKFLLSERKIFSKRFDYAGTLDAEAMVDGKLDVIDFKTSKAIYDEYWLQVAAYLFAREEEEGKKYDGAWIIRIDKTTGEMECDRKTRKELAILYKKFLAALSLYQWKMSIRKHNDTKN